MAKVRADDPKSFTVIPVLLENLGIFRGMTLGDIADEQGNQFHVRAVQPHRGSVQWHL